MNDRKRPLVLVVDDSALIRRLTVGLLESAGYRVAQCQDALDAPGAIEGEHPDLVLLDVRMPTVSGPELLATLQRYRWCEGTPIVLFSSIEDERLNALATRYGAAGCIAKGSPFDGPRILRQVRGYLLGRRTAPRHTALVVDDSRTMRRVLCAILDELGLASIEAENGREALARLEEAPPPGGIRMAMVDLHMPVMDGFAFVQAVRAERQDHDLTIVLVTSETDLDVVKRVLAAGADEYVFKPFTKEDIVGRLRMLGIPTRFSESPARRGVATGGPGGPP